MKYLLAIIFTSLAISSAYANTCQFRKFVYGSPVAPADLNYNFNEVNNCTSGGLGSGYKGCISWAAKELGDSSSDHYSYFFLIPSLAGGKTLADLGDDADIYIVNTAVQATDVHFTVYKKNNPSSSCDEINLTGYDTYTANFDSLLKTTCHLTSPSDAQSILIYPDHIESPSGQIKLDIQAYACLTSS